MHRFNANHLQDVAAARAAAADAKFQAEFPHLHRAEMRRKAKAALAGPTRAPVSKRVPVKPTTAPVADKRTTTKALVKPTLPVKPTLVAKPVARQAARVPKVLAPTTMTRTAKPPSSVLQPSPACIKPTRSPLVVSHSEAPARSVAPLNEAAAPAATTEAPIAACNCKLVIVALEDENSRLKEELRVAQMALVEYASKVQLLEAALRTPGVKSLASLSGEDVGLNTASTTMTPTEAPCVLPVADVEPCSSAATTTLSSEEVVPTALSAVSRSPTPRGDASHAGLVNLGNTCYMNAILQCLAHTPPLVDALLSQHSESNTARALARVVSGILANDAASYRCDQEALMPPFHSASKQQDASEYLSWLVSDLQAASTIPEDVFSSYWTATSTCPHCGLESEASDAYHDISFLAEETTSVAAGLANFATKTLRRTCDRCHIFGTSEQHWAILLAPPVLVLTLNATNYNVKGTSRVVVDEMLALGAVHYRLVGLVGHRGASVLGGHYVAYVRRSNGWLCMNDALVSVVSPRAVFAQRAYVLFYERMADES